MKKAFIGLALCFVMVPAMSFAKASVKKDARKIASSEKLELSKIKCTADKFGANRAEVPVQRTMGAAPESKTDFQGTKVAVGFYQGTEYEGQQVLAIEVGGSVSQIYDPGQSLYMLTAANGIRVQCYHER